MPRKGRGQRPAHLKGREIGLWHAEKNKKRREEMNVEGRSEVNLTRPDKVDKRKQRTPAELQQKREERKQRKEERKQKKEEGERERRCEVAISSQDSERISLLLARANAPPVPPQPAQRFLPMDTDEEPGVSTAEPQPSAGFSGEAPEVDTGEEPGVSTAQPEPSTAFAGEAPEVELELAEALDELGEYFVAPPAMEPLPVMTRDPAGDASAKRVLKETRASHGYQRFQEFREQLPAFQFRDQIVRLLEQHRVVVVSGETGCGKTTQVPQFLMEAEVEANRGSVCRIVVTQPRRISAISVAHRVAEERGEALGRGVGYQIRLECVPPQRTEGTILFCTTGIVLQRMQGDRSIGHVSHLIVDEIHERDLQTDLLLVLLKDLLRERADLKVILMSATLNAHRFADYFGLPREALLHIPGRTFPVTEYTLEQTLAMMQYRCDPAMLEEMERLGRKGVRNIWKQQEKRQEEQETQQQFEVFLRSCNAPPAHREFMRALGWRQKVPNRFVAEVVEFILRTTDTGAILVFLPGWADIKETIKILQEEMLPRSKYAKVLLYPLHSMLPTANQREIFNRPPPGTRKVIVATNIAETSITIDDVVFVVDCGQIKVTQYDPFTHTNVMQAVLESRANSTQRAGRAGRVQPGRCLHLYTTFHRDVLIEAELPPEMLRTRLEETILQIKVLNCGHAQQFLAKAMDPPTERRILSALTFLRKINAITAGEEEALTPLGRHLARLPVDCLCGKMILLGSLFSCLDPILSIAASLGYRDPFFIPMGKERQVDERRLTLSQGSYSDHILLANVLDEYERRVRRGTQRQFLWENYLSEPVLKQLVGMKKQFADILHNFGYTASANPKAPAANRHSNNQTLVKALVCAGLYPNVAKAAGERGKKMDRIKISGPPKDPNMCLHPKSVAKSMPTYGDVWLVYFERMRLNQDPRASLFDVTPVGSLPLLFFGGELRSEKERQRIVICVDDWMKFNSSCSETPRLVRDLRAKLDEVLEMKVKRPTPIEWDANHTDSHIMCAIVELLSRGE